MTKILDFFSSNLLSCYNKAISREEKKICVLVSNVWFGTVYKSYYDMDCVPMVILKYAINLSKTEYLCLCKGTKDYRIDTGRISPG